MNFEGKQSNVSIEDNQNQKATIFYDDCEKIYFSCNIVPKEIDTMKMGENIWKTYVLNVKLLDLTNVLWRSLLSVINKSEIVDEKGACYEIKDAKNCNSLNMHFDFFSKHLVKYQSMHTTSWEHKDYVEIQQLFMSSIEAFLSLSLPSLENDIENIILKVKNQKEGDKIYTSLNKKNVAPVINEGIFNYTRRVREEIVRFKLVDVPRDLSDRKNRIENLIDRAYRIKQRYLKKLASSTTTTTTTVEPIISTDNFLFETDNEIKSFPTQTFKITDTSYPTEQTSIYTFTENAQDMSFKKNISGTLFSDLENDVNSRTTTNWIIIGSVFSILFFVIPLIVYCVIKYKSKKKMFKKNNSVLIKNDNLNNESKVFSIKVPTI